MARKLMVEIVGDASSLEHAFGRSSAAAEGFGSKLGGLAKAALLVGGAAAVGGLAVVLDKSVHAALAGQTAQAALDQALKNTHQSVKAMTPALDEANSAARRLGFTDVESETALARLETATGSTTKAIADEGVAMDIARFKHTDLTNASQMLAMAMTGSQRAAKQLGISVAPVTTNMDALKASHENLTTAIGKADAAQAKLADKMATGQAVIAAVTEKVHGQAQAYAETAAGGMASFSAQVEFMEQKLGNALLPAMVSVMTWVNAHWPQIQAVFQTTAHAIGAAIEFVKPYLQELIAVAGQAVAYVRDHWPEISSTARRVFNDVRGTIEAVASVVRAVWGALGGTITSVARTAFGSVRGFVENMYGTISGIFALIGDLVHGRWSKIWGDLVSIVSHQMAAMWSLLRGTAAIAGTILYDAGRAIIEGLVKGIESMAGAARDAAVNAVKGAANAAKGFLGIHSPSRLFQQMGVDTMLGYINGINGATPKVREAMQRTMGFVAADARRGVAEVITTIEGAWQSMSVTATGGSGLKTSPTQYANGDGSPLADWIVNNQIQASLAANPNGSTGGYDGPVMGDQYGAAATTVVVQMPNYLGSLDDAAEQIRRALLRTSGRTGRLGLA